MGGTVLVGKGRNRRQGAHQDNLFIVGEKLPRQFQEVGHQLHLYPALAPGQPGREGFSQQLRAGFGGDTPGKFQSLIAQGVGAQQQTGPATIG